MEIFHPIGWLALFLVKKSPKAAAPVIFRILFGEDVL
jgi:hypothetical protein